MEGHGRLAKKREVIDDNLIKSQIKIKTRPHSSALAHLSLSRSPISLVDIPPCLSLV